MKEPDVNEIAANLREVVSRFVKIIKSEAKNDDIFSLTERSTLYMIYRYTEILPSELASIEKVTTQSMSQIISKLLKYGYISKTPSDEDKRKVIIKITEAGKEFILKKRDQTQEWLAKSILEKTNQKEKEMLVDAIKVLTKLVDLK